MKKLFGLGVAGVAAISLASCGSTIKIGVVLPDEREDRWVYQDKVFIEEALIEAGYSSDEYQILFSDGDDAKEKTNVESLIAKGAEAIIITAQGSGSGAVAAAADADVPLISHDRLSKDADGNGTEFYTTFNSWSVGQAQGQYLVDKAIENGCTTAAPCDLAIFAGRVADYPNATYFFGGAMDILEHEISRFSLINTDPVTNSLNDLLTGGYTITEAGLNSELTTALQTVMGPIDTDWNAETATTKGQAIFRADNKKITEGGKLYVLAPADIVATGLRPTIDRDLVGEDIYTGYYITGQDGNDVEIASLLGDPDKGKGYQTMTVFKNTQLLANDSVKIADNIVNGRNGSDGLTNEGTQISGARSFYSPVTTYTNENRQAIYDGLFATGFKSETNPTFSNIDFSQWKA